MLTEIIQILINTFDFILTLSNKMHYIKRCTETCNKNKIRKKTMNFNIKGN